MFDFEAKRILLPFLHNKGHNSIVLQLSCNILFKTSREIVEADEIMIKKRLPCKLLHHINNDYIPIGYGYNFSLK